MKTNRKCRYFKLYELLPPELYIDETKGWDLIDDRLKDTIDWVRRLAGVPLLCNTWNMRGTRRDSGYRAADCRTGAKSSMHKKGMAADLISDKVTAARMRETILANASSAPCNIRLEADVDWLHVDVKDTGRKVYLFKA